ncbi:hypothetical protein M378DRAFT_73687 [Amanita muscaria Koide BX008]|uniref:Rhodanese domain-containing protein n=1 Tax=Amanita muscaria (strain Koide BX008) TaxID=946122 RepID=A0A0C2XF20_AMAMK|nr:hypothetical protein M378DRAFT_73687 [Amanita muscaria Koide BX008]
MLKQQEYELYGRQMILSGFGLSGQLKLRQAAVAVVGAGGLGCPALQYLAAAGIGRVAIIDHDTVELSNLQRQVLHREKTIGWNKAKSAADALSIQYPWLDTEVYEHAVTAENALGLLRPYDLVLDCTDNAPTRYLLSDACVLLNKPLISGAAQKYDGQLCTYNLGIYGPCYRCLFPKPPAPKLLRSCGETGVLGVVTGVIGNLQALEAIKILTGLHDMKPSLLLFSALTQPPFRTVKLRSRKEKCSACGIDKPSDLPHAADYVQFCGGDKRDWEAEGLQSGDPKKRVTAKGTILASSESKNLIDVRPQVEFEICRIPGFINAPLDEIVSNPENYLPLDPNMDTYIVCRLGNDSQIAAEALRILNRSNAIKDIIGGLRAWTNNVDNDFPIY